MGHGLPSYGTGFARNAAESANPSLWRGLVGAWAPSLGPTGLTLRDWSGYGNHGTLTAMDPATDWVAGEKGWAINMIQPQKIITRNLGLSAKPMTVSGWFNVASHASEAYFLSVVSWFGGGAGLDWRLLWYGNDTRIAFTKYCSVTSFSDIGQGVYSFGEWTHFALTYDGGILGSGVSWYTQGKHRWTGVGVGAGTPSTSTAAFVMGAHTTAFDCTFGSILVHDRILPPSEIQHLAADPHALFRERRWVYPAAAAPAGIAPTSHLYGSLAGPFAGAI